jgi:CRISPR-associated protein Csx3
MDHNVAMPFELRNAAGITIGIHDTGSIGAIRAGPILVNQVPGTRAEGGIGNVHLRLRTRDGIAAYPLAGPASAGSFRAGDQAIEWSRTVAGLRSVLALRLAPDDPAWFWIARLTNEGAGPVELDLVLAQDLGIAAEAAVRTSELYASQYIDHTVHEHDRFGFLVCSRQNLPQDGAAPWIMHGCLDRAVGYLTDGFQFHGLDYRVSNRPAALAAPQLPNRRFQYELAMPALQSAPVSLEPGHSTEVTFFAAYEADHPGASGRADSVRADRAAAIRRGLPALALDSEPRPTVAGRFDAPAMFPSEDLPEADVRRFFAGPWRHEERRDGQLVSFFHGDQHHVVLRAKEVSVERPTGHLMRSGRDLLPTDDALAVTAWMFGVFASQLTIGNTSFHKVLGVVRNPLNVLKASGQRVFVRSDRGEELLGVPSAFEMGPNSARWLYRAADRTVSITTTTALDGPACRFDAEVLAGGPLELVISHELVLGEHEGGPPPEVEIDRSAGTVRMRPGSGTLMRGRYPASTVLLVAPEPESVERIELEGAHLVVTTRSVGRFSLVIAGSIVDGARADALAAEHRRTAADDVPTVTAFWTGLRHGARLGGGTGRFADDLARLDDVMRWYAHNAMVHYLSPHGLEQSGGAAWGVRDVCQGPVEFLLATGNPGPVRDVLHSVYEHQYAGTRDWPQWFMFDRYREIQQPDSHGDVIHWPLKALCDYVEATNDFSILDDEVAWTDERSFALTADTSSIFAHAERQVDRIEAETIAGTALPIFGGGDWEDTLQPADPAMARQLVSSWTAELMFQTLGRFAEVCRRGGRDAMADRLGTLTGRIRDDFNRYLVPDGVVAGIAFFGGDEVEYFLHARDQRTGVRYRLLPMTRGVISGLFTPEQADRHLELVERHLLFPDGARLMDCPMEYRGGPSRFFKRAESAANFGREIGLQYVHAHLRYVEAMARRGRADAAFRGLLAICPIGLERDVPSALPRQANAYFSSSDAAVHDRYEASREFERLRTGQIGVKGGWRIYSSGPGIFINQLVSNVLGLRTWFDDVVVDPVLPRGADGLTYDAEFEGRKVRWQYEVTGDGFGPREIRVNGRSVPGARPAANPYRPGGLLIPRTTFVNALDQGSNRVDVAM